MEVKIIDNVVHMYYNSELIAWCSKGLAHDEWYWDVVICRDHQMSQHAIRATCAASWRQLQFTAKVIVEKLIP